MNVKREVSQPNASLIPIPYGCMTIFIVVLGGLLLSSAAIGIAILK
ncbi:MAG: hypothetical protein WB566_00445 [Terriglobales bacterium]